jgi:hypothetical protein
MRRSYAFGIDLRFRHIKVLAYRGKAVKPLQVCNQTAVVGAV